MVRFSNEFHALYGWIIPLSILMIEDPLVLQTDDYQPTFLTITYYLPLAGISFKFSLDAPTITCSPSNSNKQTKALVTFSMIAGRRLPDERCLISDSPGAQLVNGSAQRPSIEAALCRLPPHRLRPYNYWFPSHDRNTLAHL
jgi:hypothetical protein